MILIQHLATSALWQGIWPCCFVDFRSVFLNWSDESDWWRSLSSFHIQQFTRKHPAFPHFTQLFFSCHSRLDNGAYCYKINHVYVYIQVCHFNRTLTIVLTWLLSMLARLLTHYYFISCSCVFLADKSINGCYSISFLTYFSALIFPPLPPWWCS